MKFFALLLLAVCGLVAANPVHEALDQSVEDFIEAFKRGIEEVPNIDDQDDDATTSPLVQSLQERLAELVQQFKTRVDGHHEGGKDLLSKMSEVTDRLQDMHANVGAKVRELVEKYKGKGKDFIEKIMEHFRNMRNKRQAEQDEELPSGTDTKTALINHLRGVLESTVQKIKDRVDEHHEKAKEFVAKATETADRLKQVRGTLSESFKTWLGSYHGKAREVIDRIMNHLTGKAQADDAIEEEIDEEERRKRSVDDEIHHLEKRALSEVTEQVSSFIKELQDRNKERLSNFAQWLREVWSVGLSAARGQHERLIAVAKEVRDHAREMRKETVREAIEALRPHKEELGQLWKEVSAKARAALLGRTAAPEDQE